MNVAYSQEKVFVCAQTDYPKTLVFGDNECPSCLPPCCDGDRRLADGSELCNCDGTIIGVADVCALCPPTQTPTGSVSCILFLLCFFCKTEYHYNNQSHLYMSFFNSQPSKSPVTSDVSTYNLVIP